MGQIYFKHPDLLGFKSLEDWPQWKQYLEQFHVTSGLSNAAEVKQINVLLYLMDEDASIY